MQTCKLSWTRNYINDPVKSNDIQRIISKEATLVLSQAIISGNVLDLNHQLSCMNEATKHTVDFDKELKKETRFTVKIHF